MQIDLIPMRSDDALHLTRRADLLSVNGIELDFTPLQEGDVLPRASVDCPWLASDVTRQDGQIRLALILPHGADAPEAARFPAPLILNADGPVDLPGQSEELAS